MYFYRERTFCRIARGVRHTDGNAARELVRMVVTGSGSFMLLAAAKLVDVVHRPAAVRSLRRAGHRHGNAVHRHHVARHIGAVAGNGHLPAAFAAHGNHAVFAVQLHRKRTTAGNAVFRMLTGTAGKRAFVHHDVGFTRSRCHHRHHGHALITRDVDGQRRFRGIAVLIRDGVGELFRVRRALRHVHARVQRVGVGAVLVQRQRAVGAVHRLTQRAAFNGRHCLVRRGIRAKHVVGQHVVTTAARLRLHFRKCDIVGHGHWHVVDDDHAYHAGASGAVGVRHRHHKVMRDAVRTLTAVLLCGLREMEGVVQPPCGRVKAGHFQIAFIRGYHCAGERPVEHQHAPDDDVRHTIGRVDSHGARGDCCPLSAQT